jgi:hypothetical protein
MHHLIIESSTDISEAQFHNSYVNLFSFLCMEGK